VARWKVFTGSWWESGLVWGAISLFLAGVSFALAGKYQLAHWLLGFAWLTGSLGFARAFARVRPRKARIRRTIVAAVFLAIAVRWADVRATPGVTVGPRHAKYPASTHRANFIYAVRNHLDDHVYSIEMKLRLYGASFQDFTFDIPEGSRKPASEGSKFADMEGVGCRDQDGNGIVLIWIYRMAPGSTREVSATHNDDVDTKVDATISYYTTEPLPRMDDVTQASGTIHADEKMTCNGGIGFWLDPNAPPRHFTFSGQKHAGS